VATHEQATPQEAPEPPTNALVPLQVATPATSATVAPTQPATPNGKRRFGRQRRPAAHAFSGARSRWELIIAVAIGITTMTGAILTYLAIREESAAADHDRRAVIETVQVNRRLTAAETQAHAFSGLAASYRRMVAEADAIADEDPERAQALYALAQSFATQARIAEFMPAAGADAQFNYEGAFQAALHADDAVGISDDQPDRTVAMANDHHTRSQRLTLSVVGLLVVVVLLTLARLVRATARRTALLALSATGYAATLVAAVPQVF
jgi:hypothetical protein